MTRDWMDINADGGESFGRWVLGADAELFAQVSSANIACGYHAGDPVNMRKAVRAAKAAGIAVGAHPGFPDLLGFGRRKWDIPDDDVVDYIVYQVGALAAIAATEGVELAHVKPHGVLYGRVDRDADTSLAVAEALQLIRPGMPLVAAPGPGVDALRKHGLPVIVESAVDLEYTDDGLMIVEKQPQPKDPALIAQRALDMADGFVTSVNGRKVHLEVESICVHGDRPGAPAIAAAVRAALESAGISVEAPGDRVLATVR